MFIICSLFMFFGFYNVNATSQVDTVNKTEDTVVLNKSKITKVKAKKKSLKVTWKKIDKATGYQYAYKNTKAKKYKYKNTTSTSIKIKKLKSNKKYIIKVRAYTKVNGKTVYGPWSDVKKVKTKKKIKNSGYVSKSSSRKSVSRKKSSKKNSATVYVTRTGKRYHSHSGCRGLSHARAVFYTTMSDAISRGLTKCQLCW